MACLRTCISDNWRPIIVHAPYKTISHRLRALDVEGFYILLEERWMEIDGDGMMNLN